MSKVTYQVVEHDGGWAYRVDGAYSETFPTHDAARRAAETAAAELMGALAKSPPEPKPQSPGKKRRSTR